MGCQAKLMGQRETDYVQERYRDDFLYYGVPGEAYGAARNGSMEIVNTGLDELSQWYPHGPSPIQIRRHRAVARPMPVWLYSDKWGIWASFWSISSFPGLLFALQTLTFGLCFDLFVPWYNTTQHTSGTADQTWWILYLLQLLSITLSSPLPGRLTALHFLVDFIPILLCCGTAEHNTTPEHNTTAPQHDATRLDTRQNNIELLQLTRRARLNANWLMYD